MTTGARDLAPGEIRRDIEQTRARMGETIEALGDRLNPSRLRQQMKDNVREATIGRVRTMADNARNRMTQGGRGLVETVKENPIPAAMIVGGLGWLLFGSRRQEASESSETPGVARRAAGSTQAAAHRVAESTGAAAHRVAESTGAAAHRLAESTGAAAHRVADRSQVVAQRVTRRVSETYDESPLILGAFAAAAGLAIGISMPASRREAALMGAKRDELVDRAKERVQDTAERAKHAAERAVPEVRDTLKEVARDEGLPGA